VRGFDDPRTGALAEDRREPRDRQPRALDQIREHATRSDRGQLVDVADQHDPHPRRHRTEQVVGELQVEHRALVDDEHVALEPVLRVALEAVDAGLPLEQAVEGGRGACPVDSSRRFAARPVGAASRSV
jgi:hypothetical protein